MLKKFFTFSRFTLFVALCISAIAAYYSVVGLTAIFAGAVIPIMVMGTILEIAKITTTVWLHKYWSRAGWTIKSYLTGAVIALAFLTSMGVFGLLSKAHSDTGLVGGDVAAQLSLIDEKIKTQRDNIDVARKALQQMDEQVNQRLSRSDSEQAAERAVQIRRQQGAERNKLLKEIADAQGAIAKLNDERAPIAAKNRKVEAEVGPVKYIAALIYGDNPDATLLERAVRWVIILIVIVFDPLAIVLILAANTSLKWDRELKEGSSIQNSSKEINVQNGEIDVTRMTPWPQVWDSGDSPDKIEDEPEKTASEQNVSDVTGNTPTDNTSVDPERSPSTPDTGSAPSFKLDNYITNYTVKTPEFSLESVNPKIDPPGQAKEENNNIDQKEIVTDGVTKKIELFSSDENYVTYEGKKTSIGALKELRPDLIVNGPIKNDILFGNKFPIQAKTGDMYIRVDVLPHNVYKFNGVKWIQVSRKQNSSYLQNAAYLQYLISKLDKGEYDPGFLTEDEQEEISNYLKNTF